MSLLKISVLLSLISFGSTLTGQNTILDAWAATEDGREVFLNWTISKGNTCNGIDILRSTDSLNFNVIGNIEGICGDIEEAVHYSFEDKNPPRNIKIFYRLQLGAVETSEIISIRLINYGNDGYLAMPNPFKSHTNVYFRNENNASHDLYLFDINGRKVRQMKSRNNYFNIEKKELNSGLYVFIISSEKSGRKISGKLLVSN